MTRINIIPPQELVKEHFLGEWKEITRPVTNVRKYMDKETDPPRLEGDWRLNKGHVTWYYWRLGCLKQRYEAMYAEGKRRGYEMNKIDTLFDGIPDKYFGDYTPTPEALIINRQRIKQRLTTKK